MWWKPLFWFYLALPEVLGVVFILWTVYRSRRTTRWPISQKLLRPPGESLRRKLEKLDEGVLMQFCYVGFLWCLSLWVMLQLQRRLAPNSWTVFFSILGIGIVGAVAGGWWIDRYFRNLSNHSLGYCGERVVGVGLNQLLRDGCHVFHDFPADPKWNIDHIIVAPSGVYAVETKTRRKRRAQKGKPDHVIIYDGDTLSFPHAEQNRYGLDQVIANAKWLSGYLSSATGEKVWVEPILTFPGWWIERRAKITGVQVFNPGEILPYVLSRPARLTAQSIKQIVHQLDQKCRDVEF